MTWTTHQTLVSGSFFALGTCAWALANAIFAELPIILGWTGDWTLASKIALCIALANLAPLLWSILADLRNGKTIVPSSVGIGFILFLGMATSICFMVLDNLDEATPLLTLSILTGIVGSMTLVLFFPHAHPFAIRDNGVSIASLQMGTAAASLFLAIMAIIQKPASVNPRFSLEAYFGIVTAFFALALMGWAGTLMLQPAAIVTENALKTEKDITQENSDNKDDDIMEAGVGVTKPEGETETSVADEEAPTELRLDFWNVFLHIATDARFREANAVQFIINAMMFFLPGVVPYSVSYFPNPELALHYQTVVQLLAQTIAILLTGLPFTNIRNTQVGYQLIVAIVFWIPTVVLCVHNNRDFHTSQANSALPIALYAAFAFVYGYTSTTCFQVVSARCEEDKDNGAHVSRVLGLLNQMGAMLGSIVGYLVVQNGKIY